MNEQTKIVIAGIGGVGGYFGGLLARAYAGNDNIEVYFFARGEHLAKITESGLKVIKGEIEFAAHPFLATDNAQHIGVANYLLLCTKNYDLSQVLAELAPCIDENTVILPLLNGVQAVQIIRDRFPSNLVPAGCAYIVSAIKEPGVVENMGNRQEIYFGLDHTTHERLATFEDLFKAAGIEATLSNQVSKVIWEKFIFLSCIATATSYYNKTVGELLLNQKDDLLHLLSESTAIATALAIPVDPEISDKALTHYRSLPFSATSSMHRDFQSNNSRTELESITGYVVSQAKKLGVETPYFEKAYLTLAQR